jgi:predicted RNA-binding Zn ribbon-like protein
LAELDLPRPDVPRVIAVVRDFVNTTDHETGIDDLTTQADLARYFVQEHLLEHPPRVSAPDLALARELRSELRKGLEMNHDGVVGVSPSPSSAFRSLPIGMDWGADGPALRATTAGARGALAKIGLAAHEAVTQGIWQRLKICSFDECEWAYYDNSKNRSRNWCEYGCGNKVKTRAYRTRQRASTGPVG